MLSRPVKLIIKLLAEEYPRALDVARSAVLEAFAETDHEFGADYGPLVLESAREAGWTGNTTNVYEALDFLALKASQPPASEARPVALPMGTRPLTPTQTVAIFDVCQGASEAGRAIQHMIELISAEPLMFEGDVQRTPAIDWGALPALCRALADIGAKGADPYRAAAAFRKAEPEKPLDGYVVRWGREGKYLMGGIFTDDPSRATVFKTASAAEAAIDALPNWGPKPDCVVITRYALFSIETNPAP